ncbi:TPA: dihydroxyacetone kinase subunit DhaK [Kluyvera cryocrescens]|uniref:Dihydroxyacetone kinase subunit DhaK n=1 Tax=Kluyvera cryocrescens TaxID=580 RepID=A0AAW9CCB4_KLUCR|nr:dihydroxyacetone kinase subunit DhaK [Kluyvera cryocrescens]MCX2869035.1 dihydroxyacetone kinase subunit DhaK [Kluyvera cryocrescens]MDU5684663.1 dihydroxyacetone kinase subunit DhaK [Kluyvera cryocrescens]MDW3779199.1 dihydroxyacetone kinase subunit DhaK [Kluyvera cryocrescens]MEB7558520.1 dihydroxyacetone kinase subunit DhaK [Kluyvera cryocrescens]MEB7714991.1 dihydroxyacetone kinase subunit DhaK [Kluyvera cryocrescens]
MSRFFFNDRKQLVDEAIEGLVLSAPHGNLLRLDVDPAIRIVARSDWDKSRVAIISGGGSGHEPAHAGFVGKGMLTAAVCGDVFASPSVDAVLNAIVAVTGDRGCLLIVKNYTGDRLNFGLAAEKAKRYGLKVEMVIVADDIALPENKQPRGIAGTALVHKIAGYAAEQGKSLSEVHAIAQRACDNVFSLGLAMKSCNLPGSEAEERIKPGQVELGLGIHGEPGASIVSSHNSQALVDTLAQTLKASVGDSRVAVLINNLGGVSELEMALLTKALAHSALREQIAYLIGPATLVSSLDMKGFSLSLLMLNDATEQALLAEVETVGWVKATAFGPLKTLQHAKVHDALDVQPSENARIHDVVARTTQTLLGLEERLNALDAKVGDGDTGSTFALGAQDIATQLARHALPLNEPAQLLQFVGERLATVMGGSSGVLMSLFFTAAGQALSQGEPMPNALLAGLKQMKFYGGAQVGDRTLIDALQPALEALRDSGLDEAIRAAQRGAESTATMQQAKAGRASYVNSDNLNGVPDPGAVAVAEVFAALSTDER